MTGSPHVLVPRDALNKIAASKERDGRMVLRHVPADDLFVIASVETSPSVRQQVDVPKKYAVLRSGDATFEGRWVRSTDHRANVTHRELLHRPGALLPFGEVRDILGTAIDPGAKSTYVITCDDDLPGELVAAGVPAFAGWFVSRDGAAPFPTSVEPEQHGLLQLGGRWPLEQTASLSVAVVGCGSIGSAAAKALAAFGVGSLHLIDPDRLLWHNLIRHQLGPDSVGRHKVDALAESIRDEWGVQGVVPHRSDVVHNASAFRAVASGVDLVLCAADGIAPRRVVSHVSRRLGIPAILACVLDNGAVGEIIRLRPTPRFGCLLCLRAKLAADGAMDVEADQELAYGTGEIHKPMTALPADLEYMGILAAKAAVATLLESKYGDSSQVLPGEHAIVGLRPLGDLAAPFNVGNAAEIRWLGIAAPREGCPTCQR